ncbi:6,7-dimethyl-8-ribityllumazine synthase [Candidatus Calescamantes bacterium]|nr:6,7-dimethyl-8-ribityllumazine synthase [Candidatus Calescamantes bacterium]
MAKEIKGELVSKGKRFGIVISRFNEFISAKLLEGCLDTLYRHGVKEDEVEICWVPGSFEIPVVALKLAEKKDLDGVICLGVLIRGDTPHFDYIAKEVSKGIAEASFRSKKPVIFGIITADTIEQAVERAGTKQGNKGRDAALAAIEMVNLLEKIG